MGPLFVLSVFRSGSTLLYALLNQHSKISLLYEADLPRMQLFLWGQFRNGGWRQRWEFWNQAPSRHGIAIESMPATVSNVWEATRIVYQSVARRKQAIVWGEKSPRWYDSPLQLTRKFPDARFIFLWRDPNRVIDSIVRAAATERSFGKAGLAREVLVGTERLKHACDLLRRQGRPVHEINYEDLTGNPEFCMRQICEFLRIPFENQMTSLEGADRSAIFPGECHTLVKGDRIVDQGGTKQMLSPALQAKIARYICRWKRSPGGAWPKYPVAVVEGVKPTPWLELWLDRITDELLLLWGKIAIVLLHQIRPLFYPKKYVRDPKVASGDVVGRNVGADTGQGSM
jgi:hypothetical protein